MEKRSTLGIYLVWNYVRNRSELEGKGKKKKKDEEGKGNLTCYHKRWKKIGLSNEPKM